MQDMMEANSAACASLHRDQTEAVVEFVLNSPARVVVIIGARNSGKSDFIRSQVVPRLESYGPVRLFDCVCGLIDEAIESITQPGTVVILDSFDRFLSLPGEVRDAGLRSIFSGRRRATLVLITDSQTLPDIFSLRHLVPDILENFFELTELKLATELPRFSPSPVVAPLAWDPNLIKGLELGLARLGEPAVTLPLLAIIDESVRTGNYDPKLLMEEGSGTGKYDPKLGMQDLLERHLERTLAQLSSQPGYGEDASDAARALLKEVIRQHGTVTLTGLTEQLDISADMLASCWRWLVETSGLLRDSQRVDLAFRPPQLRPVLEKWLEEDANACAKVADGMDARRKLGALLPYDRFIDVHAKRKSLRTTPEQAAYLALCALRSCPEADAKPIEYWFRRIGDPGLEMNTLLDGLGDPTPRARCRAAARLASFDDPKVHGHLCRAALEDAAPEVRRQALESLSAFRNRGPIREVLTRTALDEKNATRVHAIEALRLFPDEECARFLEDIVSKPWDVNVRAAAIDALAQTRCEMGISALVRIALLDSDEEDRDRAGMALSVLDQPSLVECGLEATFNDWAASRPAPTGRWWKKVGFWPATLVILIMGLLLHGVPLLVLRKWLAASAFLILEVACLWLGIVYLPPGFSLLPFFLSWCASVTTAAWVARRHNPRPGSFHAMFSSALLANTMISCGTWFHGVGHWITGRKRQAWQLLGIEIIALLAMLSVLGIQNVFTVGITHGDFRGFGSSLVYAYDSLTSFLFYLYLVGGMTLSWVVSASWLMIDERWGRRGPWLSEPHSRVLRALLRGPQAAALLRGHLSSTPTKARSARMLLKHFGDALPGDALLSVLEQDLRRGSAAAPEIVRCLSRNKNKRGYETVVKRAGELLDCLPAGRTRPLIRMLASWPTDASVRGLFERRRMLRRADRIRSWLAAIVRPFQGWHWVVRVAVSAGAVLLVLLVIDSLRTSNNPAWPQIKEFRRLAKVDYAKYWREEISNQPATPNKAFQILSNTEYLDHSRDFATIATFLASGNPRIAVNSVAEIYPWIHRKYARDVAEDLGTIAASADPETRRTALNALARAARIRSDIDPQVASDRRRRAEIALNAIRVLADRASADELSPEAVKTIKESLLAGASETGDPGASQPLERRGSSSVASLNAPSRLRLMATRLSMQAEQLEKNGQFDEALLAARSAIEADETYVRAYCVQALVMKDLKRYDEAQASLKQAIQLAPAYSWSYAILIDTYHAQGFDREAVLELQRLQRAYPTVGEILFYLAVVYQERISPVDPAAFELAYATDQKLLKMVRNRNQALALSTELNLEENRLTTGRYSELIQKQPELLRQVGQDPDGRLALTLLMLSAQVLIHDQRKALATLADLRRIYEDELKPTGKRHTWVYIGTEAYLDRRVPRSPQTAALLALVRAVNKISGTGTETTTAPPFISQELFDRLRQTLERSR